MITAGVVGIVALALGGGAVAKSTGAFDHDAQLKGSTAEHAKAAALRATGGGEVNASERDNEKGATYEVEVTKPNGKTVDVRLDGAYNVVAIDGDQEDGGGDGPDGAGN
jgi:uncharacterized membrane protein YkoI